MARTETWFDQDLKKPVSVRIMAGVQFSEDNQGSLIGVRVYDDGADATLTGGATGYCILADGQTITVDGTREGNTAYILLPQSALVVPGPIQITIKLVDDSVITTLLACVGTVIRTKIGVPVVPGSVIEEWSEQISETLQDCVDDCQAAADAMGANLATTYSTSATYPVGAYVIQSGTLYRCTTAVTTAGSWATNSSKFVAVKLANDVADLKSAFVESVGDLQYVENTSGTGNLYCDRTISLTGGEVIQIKICDWSLPLANRTSITVYARGNSNVSIGTIDVNTEIPSDVYEFTVPSSSFTSIRVAFKANTAAGSASVLIGIKRNTYITTVEKKIDNIGGQVDIINDRIDGLGFAFNVTGTSTTKNIYCDKNFSFSGGGKIAVRILKWSSLLRHSIRLYVFNGEESTNLGLFPIPYSEDAYYTFDVPSGEYDKVRVAFQNTVADGTTECQALIVCATDGAITNGFIDNQIGKLNGIKINCLGDSLTYGYVPSSAGTSPMSPTWCQQLAVDLQCTVRNYGITNNAVSNNTGGTGDPMCIRYSTMDDDADIVIVMGGTNDFLRVNAPLGTIDSVDNTTFYGAYNVLVQGLLSKYMTRKTRIILMVPPMRNRSTEHNTQGTTLQQIQQAVRDIAHKYALPYVDWAYDAGLSAYLIGTDSNYVYTYDGIHIRQDIVLGWILPLIESKIIEAIKQ